MNLQLKYFVAACVIVGALIGIVNIGRSERGVSAAGEDPAKHKGPHGAPVEMIVYSDFQCPACAKVREPIENLRNQFPDQIEVKFRHFPIERIHRWALLAAQFAECAAGEGQFWPFHDRLYEEQATWAKAPNALALFVRYANDLSLNSDSFKECVTNPAILKRIRKERSGGDRFGIRSTPTIIINGEVLVGGQQLAQKGEAIVREALRTAT